MNEWFQRLQAYHWNPEALATVFEAVHQSAAPPEFRVVALGAHQQKAPLQPDSLEELQRILGWDSWTLQQRLHSPVPRIIRSFPHPQQAELFVASLQLARMNAFDFSSRELLTTEIIPAQLLEVSPQYILIRPMVGNQRRVYWAELLCAVSGSCRSQTIRETETKGLFTHRLEVDHSPVETIEMLDLHLLSTPRCWRFSGENLRDVVGHLLGAPLPAEAPHMTFERLSSWHQGLRHFHQFTGNAHLLGESLLPSFSHRQTQLLGIPGLFSRAQTSQERSLNERPLFDLYSVVCRMEMIHGLAL
jgi:hypothetical protein